jgi:exopolysaccharide biosynthesis polyprenyl glycosylphosphotransferase
MFKLSSVTGLADPPGSNASMTDLNLSPRPDPDRSANDPEAPGAQPPLRSSEIPAQLLGARAVNYGDHPVSGATMGHDGRGSSTREPSRPPHGGMKVWVPNRGSQSRSKAADSILMTPPTQFAPSASLPVARRPRFGSVARIYRSLISPSGWSRIRLLTDLVVLYVASVMALFADPHLQSVTSSRVTAFVFPLVVTALLRIRRSPDDRLNVSMLEVVAYVLGIISLATMVSISANSVVGSHESLSLNPRLWIFGMVYLGAARLALVTVRRQALRTEAIATPTLIVGAGMIGNLLVRRLIEEPCYGLRPVAFLDPDPLEAPGSLEGSNIPVLGGLENLPETISATGARRVILAFSTEPDHILVNKVRECEALGVQVSLVPRLYESINERSTLDHVGGLPLLTLHSVDPQGWQFAVKHALDRTFAALALLISSPLLIAVALAVRLSSPGPVLFRQRRVGRDGREFDVLKFRTMRVPRSTSDGFVPGDGLAPGGIEGVDRRTPVGRVLRDLSLDELPQLFNVLKGDMSVVGPRPERPEFVELFTKDVARYEDRHRVKSGITGWAQVHGLRGQTSIADRVEWDN